MLVKYYKKNVIIENIIKKYFFKYISQIILKLN